MVGTSNLGSWNGHWSNQFLSLPQDTIRKSQPKGLLMIMSAVGCYRMMTQSHFSQAFPHLGSRSWLLQSQHSVCNAACVRQNKCQEPNISGLVLSTHAQEQLIPDWYCIGKGENKGLESTMKLDLHNLHLPSESPRHQHVILFSAWLFRAPSFAIPGCGYRRGGSGSRIVEWLVVSTQKVVSIPIINIGTYIYIYPYCISISIHWWLYKFGKSSKFICSKWTHPWSY